MPTLKQKAALDKILENAGNVSKSMRQVGYAPGTSKNPKELTESKGFKQLVEESGLTDEFLNKALYEDIKEKKGNRKPELELAYKIKGKLVDKLEVETTLLLDKDEDN